jgi:hypothetical protein
MKLYKCIICIGISMIYSLGILYGEENNNKMQSAKSSTQDIKAIATFESHNKWKVSLYSKPVTRVMKRNDGTDAQLRSLVFYVETTTADTSATRRIWQNEYGIMENAPDWNPRNFIFGPADDNKLCLAFVLTGSLRFFKIDPNNTTDRPYEERDISELFNKLDEWEKTENDPNTIIPIDPIESKRIIPSYSPNTIFINSVCGYGNCSLFNLTIKGQKFILRYSIIDGKPVYSVYKLTELENKKIE